MTAFWIILGDWGYVLAAALFTALAIIASRRPLDAPAHIPLVIALAVTALWALYAVAGRALGGVPGLSGGVAETARNGAWLTVSWLLLRGKQAEMPQGARPVFVALIAALFCQLCLDLFLSEWEPPAKTSLSLFQAAWLLRAAVAAGAIFLLQGLYAGRDGGAGDNANVVGGVGWLGCALAVMWAYEFNHYLIVWLSDGHLLGIGQMRGLVMAAIAPLIMLGTGERERRRIGVSRRIAYRTAALAIGALYALMLLWMIVQIRALNDPTAQMVQLGVVFALSVMALILLPSAPFRAWLRVEIAKHLFTHRYDYRQEWMRFAEAMGGEEGGGQEGTNELAPRRAARAVANAISAPAALLMLRGEDGALTPEADWNWPEAAAPDHRIDAGLAEAWQASGWIADLAASADPITARLPRWITADPRAWAIVPLIHGGRLMGAILLTRPPGREAMDWEDLDMLRVAAKHLALTLSEQRHQRANAEAQRFDEFNRRFAFILHDIKNMVSQMSLLAANAERHAENPAFRADMVLTLKETASRMNDLITRLARPDQPRGGETDVCDLALVARSVAGQGQARERAIIAGETSLPVRGDATALAQAIGHLVQNAIDATPADGPPVRLHLSRQDDSARLTIIDCGRGMSAAFLRDGLFQPFTSTKAGGFGLGAHEARSIITGMGGQLGVASRTGEGTQFTLSLPLIAESADMSETHSMTGERKAG
ncbi:PEP-CTERM system histidine kinase PrsK [soil metagenome]